jgi:short-subunit dehydrogenase
MADLAIVTDASSGIGQAFAERLARDGWDLIVVARRRDRLDELAHRLSHEHRVGVRPVEADLSEPDQLRRLVTRSPTSLRHAREQCRARALRAVRRAAKPTWEE